MFCGFRGQVHDILIATVLAAISGGVREWHSRPASPPQPTGGVISGVPRVVDGDSLEVAGHRIRLFGIDEAIVVGYSMGGSVAQHVWRRHRAFTKGLVLAATAAEDRHHAAVVRNGAGHHDVTAVIAG